MLTTEEEIRIEQIFERVIDRRLGSASTPRIPALTTKLTVPEFAYCVQRSVYTIRERRRIDRKFKAHCQGECPIMIHPAALALYGVDSGLASSRLQQFRAQSAAQSPDTTALSPS